MRVKQISLFLENKSGRLLKVMQTLSEKNINIRALSIADTTDFGILRLIVNEPDLATKILKEQGFTVSATDVIAVEVDDEPGGLARALGALEDSGINIEYVYAFVEKSTDKALVVFRVEDIDRAIEVLNSKGINTLKGETVYNL
ncbi:MAG TPA: ACT domain-containing protein [Bacillota bacterium]|nr:ACT domain-containing protein [Bacillota bacterium]